MKKKIEPAWKKKPKKRSHSVCSGCVEEFHNKDLMKVEMKGPESMGNYYTPMCEKCIPKDSRIVKIIGNYQKIIKEINKKENIFGTKKSSKK